MEFERMCPPVEVIEQLHDEEGMTYEEIGKKFGVTRAAVHLKHTKYARQKPGHSGARIVKSCIYPEVVKCMQARGMNYADLAHETGIQYTSLYRTLSGKKKLTQDDDRRIRLALKCPFGDIFKTI